MTEKTISDVFKLLDDWRHLPKYQLERRADIYFALFLPVVLKGRFNLNAEPAIIPEFPLRKATLGIDSKGEESKNADFFAYSEGDEKVLLVELKTDMKSRRDNQDDYLKTAKTKSLKELIEGVVCISKATTDYGKYAHLLHRLSLLRLVSGCDQVGKLASCEKKNGWKAAVGKVRNEVKGEIHPHIVYILPEKSQELPKEFTQITFDEFADVVEHYSEIGKRFACSLRRWAKQDAGTMTPGGP
ncbi:MAG: hypothetical protein OYI31_00505 [Chloroflexota bacterium]|nr:hypothetical protein [Chloroflexota bacterium]MDE2940753.1 hypothetical protein [Chloroflexota bacterium]MDE3266935.1 hypothetical protein [Chloroflexota bacterium]